MYDFKEIFGHVNWLVSLKSLVQIVIICYGLIWIWRRILNTQAERLVKGVMVLIGVCAISYFAGFTLVTSVLQHLIPVAVMALLVIFQPEIRRGLGYLGRMNTFRIDFSLPNSEIDKARNDIRQIIIAVRDLSRKKIGALIVVEPPEGERDYLSPGTPVNADISATLLLTIFFPKSPLHDGAVVICKDKIVAAGVILPMSDDPKLSYRYGTRHRAAIGLSEIYDGLCIVVSEETGSISAASRGMLVRYGSADELADPLTYLYTQHGEQKTPSPLSSFLTLFSHGRASDTTHGAEPQPSVSQPSAELVQAGPAKPEIKESLRGEETREALSSLHPTEPEQVL